MSRAPKRPDWARIDSRLLELRAKELTFSEIAKLIGDLSATTLARRWAFLNGLPVTGKAIGWKPSAELVRIRQTCADAFGVTDAQITGRSRVAHICQARQAACYIIRKVRPKLSYPCIAQLFAGRDHSTIIHACRAVEARLPRDPELAGKVAALINLFGTRLDLRQHDSHVVMWREYQRQTLRAQAIAAAQRLEERRRREAAEAEARAMSDDAWEAARDPRKVFCGQCDRAVLPEAAARCGQRLCGLRERRAA